MKKSAFTKVSASLKELWCKFGGRQKKLSDNGSEIKNSPFSKVTINYGLNTYILPHTFSTIISFPTLIFEISFVPLLGCLSLVLKNKRYPSKQMEGLKSPTSS